MDLPDDSQWDETTCDLAVCQHPQCWAAIRRIQRGHPRILDSPCKTPLDYEDKLPALTVVNISDPCFQAKTLPHRQSPEFTFTKAQSALSRGSKLDSKFQGRPQEVLPNKSVIDRTNRAPKLSVLNLDEAQLPHSEDVRNMVVIWVPEESGKNVRSAEKTVTFPSQHGKKRRKKWAKKSQSAPCGSESQYTKTRSRSPGMVVPPPSPAHLFEQFSLESVPVWAQVDMLPQVLLKECLLLDGGKAMPCPEMKIQLGMMKKNLPLEKNRPDSAISSKMFLTIHRLTLQEPALRYPTYLKTSRDNLKRESHRKQQQQPQERKVKTPTKKQESKKKAKSDPGSWSTLCHRIPTGQESDTKQQQQMETEEAALKQDSMKQSKMRGFENYLNFFTRLESPAKPVTASTSKDVSSPTAIQEKIARNHSEITDKIDWNLELKLLRILQTTDDKDKENQHTVSHSEEVPSVGRRHHLEQPQPEKDAWHPEDNDL